MPSCSHSRPFQGYHLSSHQTLLHIPTHYNLPSPLSTTTDAVLAKITNYLLITTSSRYFSVLLFSKPLLCCAFLKTLSVLLATTISNSVFLFHHSLGGILFLFPSPKLVGPQDSIFDQLFFSFYTYSWEVDVIYPTASATICMLMTPNYLSSAQGSSLRIRLV